MSAASGAAEASESSETRPRPPLTRRLLAYLRPYRAPFLLGLGQVAVMSAFELLRPWPLKVIVDSVLGERPLPFGIDASRFGKTELLTLCVVAQVLLQAVLAALAYWNNRTTITIGQRMVNDLRSDLYQHLQRLSLSFHANRQVGDLLYRLTADTFAIQTLTMNGVFPVASAGMFLAGMTIVCLRIDWVLTVVALAVCPVLYFAMQRMTGRITDVSVSARELESGVYSTVQHGLSAIRVVQAFTQEEAEHRRFIDQSYASLTASRQLYLVQTLYSGVVSTLIACGTALVLWLGATRVQSGAMTVGDVLVFLGYVAALYAPVNALSQTYSTIQSAKAGMWRVFEILEAPEVVASGPRPVERERLRGEVRFENVDFSYDGSRPVLSDISFTASPGTLWMSVE